VKSLVFGGAIAIPGEGAPLFALINGSRKNLHF